MELMTRVAFVFHVRKQGQVHKVHGVYVKSAAVFFCRHVSLTQSDREGTCATQTSQRFQMQNPR